MQQTFQYYVLPYENYLQAYKCVCVKLSSGYAIKTKEKFLCHFNKQVKPFRNHFIWTIHKNFDTLSIYFDEIGSMDKGYVLIHFVYLIRFLSSFPPFFYFLHGYDVNMPYNFILVLISTS